MPPDPNKPAPALALVVFDDGRANLSPLTDLRAAFDLRTGALTTLERLERSLGPAAAVLCPDLLEGITRERHPGRLVNELPVASAPYLLVNARWVLPSADLASLAPGRALTDAHGTLLAHRGTLDDARALLAAVAAGNAPSAPSGATPIADAAVLSRPWQFRTFRDAALDADLATLHIAQTQELPPGVMQIGEHDVTIDPDAVVYPGVTLDTESGPIVIAENAAVRTGSIIKGPCFIGPGAVVLERALIQPHTAIGPRCKVSGEVGGCIFQGFSNKAHEGFLGDSYVGEWVNLGAGTTNSNLLNTYSEVIVQCAPNAPRERTGQTFFGCILGDHTKTAIATRIMTGSVVHTGVMHAATAPIIGCVPRFSWVTDEGRRVFRADKFLDVARAAMARRSCAPGPALIERLKSLHATA